MTDIHFVIIAAVTAVIFFCVGVLFARPSEALLAAAEHLERGEANKALSAYRSFKAKVESKF